MIYRVTLLAVSLWLLTHGTEILANPYPDESKVPKDAPNAYADSIDRPLTSLSSEEVIRTALPVLRLDVGWEKTSETFILNNAKVEHSGTPALLKRSLRRDPLGSYQARLIDPGTGKEMFYDSLGTGAEYRTLPRALTFRFPVPTERVEFVLFAENPRSGKSEEVLRTNLDPLSVPPAPSLPPRNGSQIDPKSDPNTGFKGQFLCGRLPKPP